MSPTGYEALIERWIAGRSLRSAALELGIHHKSLSRLRTGQSTPRAHVLSKMLTRYPEMVGTLPANGHHPHTTASKENHTP